MNKKLAGLTKLTKAQQKQITGGLLKCYDAPIGGTPYCPPGMQCINGACRVFQLHRQESYKLHERLFFKQPFFISIQFTF